MSIHTSLLLQFSLLKHLPESVLQDLSRVSSMRSFAKREVVLDKSGQALWMFFLLEGRLQATDFLQHLSGQVFLSHFQAVAALTPEVLQDPA